MNPSSRFSPAWPVVAVALLAFGSATRAHSSPPRSLASDPAAPQGTGINPVGTIVAGAPSPQAVPARSIEENSRSLRAVPGQYGGVLESDTPTPPPDPEWPNPIYTHAEAISRTVEYILWEPLPGSEVARLVSAQTFFEWAEGESPLTDPSTPVWLVGVLGESLTLSTILVDVPVPPHRDEPVAGGYYAWDANSGDYIGIGGLAPNDEWAQTYASLQALGDEPLVVEPATPIATVGPWPTDTP